MNTILTKICNCCRIILCLAITAGTLAPPAMAGPKEVFLGPANPGAENDSDQWGHGAKGTGTTSIEDDNPASGTHYFKLGNTNPAWQSCADWRSDTFPLGPAADGSAPVTFSFACKVPGKIVGKEHMRVFLRFFDITGKKCLGQKIIRVGSNTDSNMTEYRTITQKNIFSPAHAQTADVWITANIGEHWSSGPVQFDDFSVTVVPSWLSKSSVRKLTGIVVGLALIFPVAMIWNRYKRNKTA